MLALGNLTNFTKWSTTKTVFTPYKYAVELSGCNGTPMSAYFPIIIALKNDFDTALANPEFDGVLGPNTSALLADAVKNRFNFNGAKPSGTQAVGFLDPYQLWATVFVIGQALASALKHVKNAVSLASTS